MFNGKEPHTTKKFSTEYTTIPLPLNVTASTLPIGRRHPWALWATPGPCAIRLGQGCAAYPAGGFFRIPGIPNSSDWRLCDALNRERPCVVRRLFVSRRGPGQNGPGETRGSVADRCWPPAPCHRCEKQGSSALFRPGNHLDFR